MTNTRDPKDSSDPQNRPPESLRQRAELDLRAAKDCFPESSSSEDVAKLIHELRVHQIELEIQNEELRETQTALQNSQARYFELYDLAPVGYLTINDKGLILESNLTAATLLGVTKSALVKRLLSQFIDPEDQDTYYRYCRHLFLAHKEEGENVCELRMIRAGGSQIWCRLQSTKIRDEESGTLFLRAVISDITERRQIETVMRESKQRLSWVLEATEEGFWDWDIPKNRVLHNQKWFELLGLKNIAVEQAKVPAFFTSLIHEDDREVVLGKLRKTLEGGGRFQSEHRLRRSDGSYFWVFENGIIVNRDIDGKPLRMVGSFVDISERKHLEQQQRKHQNHYERLLKLEITNQTVAAIAHELNQPLSAAASYTDASQRLLQGGEPNLEKASYALDQSSQQIQRAGKVVHELFKFLRFGEVITVPANLNQIIRHVISILKEDGHFGGFKTVLNLAENLPKVNANIIQLEKVLINLIRNSIEAMQEAGMVSGAIIVTVSTAENRSCAQLTISDNGPGLAAETVKRVFEPFYTTKAGGLGMGLAISRALIEAQGGQLWCQPDDAAPGASFHLTLPFVSEDSI